MKYYSSLMLLVLLISQFTNQTAQCQDIGDLRYVNRIGLPIGAITDIEIVDSLAYIVSKGGVLHSLNLIDPESPIMGPSFVIPTESETFLSDLIIKDESMFVSIYEGIAIFDISNPIQFRILDILTDFPHCGGMVLRENHLFLGGFDSTFTILEVSNPRNPETIAEMEINIPAQDLKIQGNICYLGGSEFITVDISALDNPRILGRIEFLVNNFILDDQYAYLASGADGMNVIEIANPRDMIVVSHFAMDARMLTRSGDILYGSQRIIKFRYPDNPNDQFDISVPAVLDISNPMVPRRLRNPIELRGTVGYLTTLENLLFINWGGFFVYNVENPESWEQVAEIQPLSNSRSFYNSLVINNDQIILVDEGLKLIDYSDFRFPVVSDYLELERFGRNPVVSGDLVFCTYNNNNLVIVETRRNGTLRTISETNLGNDYIYGIYPFNNLLFLTRSGDNISIVNVSNLERPIVLSTFNLNTDIRDIVVKDHLAFFACDENGIIVVDFSDPRNPRKVHQYETPGRVWDLAIKDNYLIVAEDDLRIFNIENPEDFEEMSVFEIDSKARNIEIFDDHIFLDTWISQGDRSSSELYLLDFANPREIVVELREEVPRNASIVKYMPPYLYFNNCGLAIYNCSEVLGVETDLLFSNQSFALLSSYPNPFNNQMNLNIDLSHRADVALHLYDLQGRLIRNIRPINLLPAGNHLLPVDGRNLTGGTYFIRLTSQDKIQTIPIQLIK